MKHIKAYERMGIEKNVVEIGEKIFQEFLKHFKKEKAFTDTVDRFDVDIKEFKLDITKITIEIHYNKSFSTSRIIVGVLSRGHDTIKTLQELKEEIFHELKHLMHRLRKNEYNKGFETNKIFRSSGVQELIGQDIIGAFNNSNGNLYKHNVTLGNFLKYNKLSDNYKKLVVYLYLAESDELEARLQQMYNKAKNADNFEEILKKEEEYGNVGLRFYKDMINFKINLNEFSDYEKGNFYSLLNNNKNIQKSAKKISNYINIQAQKFMKKLHKLAYFQGTDHTIFNTE